MIVQIYEISSPGEGLALARRKTKTDRDDGHGKDLAKVERFVAGAKAVPI